jgi:hypothetical protein
MHPSTPRHPPALRQMLQKTSAWVPIALSLIVVALWLIGIAAFGVPVRQPDEGTGAHLFQICFVVESLLMTFFAIKWLPQTPTQALKVLALQIVAAIAACAPVFYFHL